MIYLDAIAIVCFLLFAILLIHRARKIRHTANFNRAGGFTVFISWLILLIFFASLTGIAYGAANPTAFNAMQTRILGSHAALQPTSHHQTTAHSSHQAAKKHSRKKAISSSTSKAKQSQPKQQTAPSKQNGTDVTWTPQNPQIQGSSTNVRFTVPKNTHVVIQGHNYHQKYGEILDDSEPQTVSISFNYAGTYDVIINHNGKEITKKLVIK